MNRDYVKYALDNVFHRKLRSWLTVLSILIGIAAIYSLVSFGNGLSSYVSDLSSEVGSDKLIIQAKGVGAPGTDSEFSISKEEIDFLGKVNGITQVLGLYMSIVEVEHTDEKKFVFGTGVPNEERDLFMEIMTVDVFEGRWIKKSDKFKVLLGYNYQFENKIFDRMVKIGDKIKVNGVEFDVVGYVESIGNPQDDSNIYVSEQAFELLFPGSIDSFGFGIARVAGDATEVALRAEEKLRKFKDQDEGQEDFFIQTFEQAIATFSSVLTVINAILFLVALVSLVVAGVNIMNTMYTAVLERTKEIGIMKAIGAQNKDILFIFLFESGFLGLVGGILGVVIGYGIAKLGGAAAAGAGYSLLRPEFSFSLTMGCLLFAFFVGSVAGFLPARQASKLKPVDALRYE